MIIPLIAIVGPTASGKTGLGVELAKLFNGEIVSADSMQIYKYMTVGTAKPTDEEMQAIPHHLIDFLEPDCKFSVAQYVELAKSKINDIHSRGKLPILVGGTGLYISSLLDNVRFADTGDSDEIRKKYMELAAEKGNDFVLECLRKVDTEAAEELHSNNLGRVVRALELFELTGKTKTWHVENSKLEPSPYDCVMIGLDYKNREILQQRIARRVDIMLANGLLDETKQLFSGDFSVTAKQAIGYKEFLPYFEQREKLANCTERIKISSRQYAKRQLTWFRRDKRINWLFIDEIGDFSEVLSQAKNLVEKCLSL